jgi:hypothetical protein
MTQALKVMEKFFSKGRSECVRQLAAGLDRTVWGKGIYTEKLVVPGARPGQIRAGARKLYDVMRRDFRMAKSAEEKGGAA